MSVVKNAMALFVFSSVQGHAVPVQRLQFNEGAHRLIVEVLSDSVIHFELSTGKEPFDPAKPLYRTPYIDSSLLDVTHHGPSWFQAHDNVIETSDLKMEIQAETLCVSMYDKVRGVELTRVCPSRLDQAWKGLEIARGPMTDIYGLGEAFLAQRIGNANGNWMGQRRSPGGDFGNAMPAFHGGATGNVQFPVMYAVGPNKTNYALFLDQVYRQEWDFRVDPWRVDMFGDQIRWFFIQGEDLPTLRTRFMTLVGRPLIPPKKAFGLWVSEYGFESWSEIFGKLKTLRAQHFPVDGFVMDLQWFGGVVSHSENSPMGRLEFDPANFPNAARVIRELAENEGLGLITIEESYVSRGLAEHRDLERLGFLARNAADRNDAFLINENPWWGIGGMIDWSHPEAGRYWHKIKRQALVDLGILGHWTDLGEPEMYRNTDDLKRTPFYYGFPELNKHAQADVHNVFSLLWHKSIYEGYQENQVTRRPWILSRSGGPGMQRYGAGMWSGDIGSNLGSLAAHFNAQMHLSLAGLDYFGSDIGGFNRGGMSLEPGTNLNEMYTQWFANGAAFDIPIRPHTENLGNNKETAPDRVGDPRSNLANLRQRYELAPYYYSLAHRAYLFGEPLMPPLVYYYQDAPSDRPDMNVREIGHQKMIGRDLMVAVVARAGERSRDVYLPPGDWYDYNVGVMTSSRGRTVNDYPEYLNGIFRLPTFARAGAIIPTAYIDSHSMNIVGKRDDGLVRDDLIVRVFMGAPGSRNEFTLYEDDGWSNSYRTGQVATTILQQSVDARQVQVRVHPTAGRYPGAPANRATIVELALRPSVALIGAQFNGQSLTQRRSLAELHESSEGYYAVQGAPWVIAKAPSLAVEKDKLFAFEFGLSAKINANSRTPVQK